MTDSLSLSLFFFSVVFHRALIFLFSFFLGTSSNCSLFSGFSCCYLTNKIVTYFLSFFGGILIFHMSWPEEDSLLSASQTRMSAMGSLCQLTCLIFPLCRSNIPAAYITLVSWPVGIILQIGRLLLKATCQFIHPY